jgi:hypothetical protein
VKTNHRRGYVAAKPRNVTVFYHGRKAVYADRVIEVYGTRQFYDGHRGMAHAKRGAKKYIRSRERFHSKVMLRESLRAKSPSSDQ